MKPSELTREEIERIGFNEQVGDGRWLYDEIESIIAARVRELEAERADIYDAGFRAAWFDAYPHGEWPDPTNPYREVSDGSE